MLKGNSPCIFQTVFSLGKGTACMAQAALPTLTHLCVTCGYSHAHSWVYNWPGKFSLSFLESLLREVGTSAGSILKSLGFAAPALLSELVFCCP